MDNNTVFGSCTFQIEAQFKKYNLIENSISQYRNKLLQVHNWMFANTHFVREALNFPITCFICYLD